jgi:hypothetical protein
MEDPPMKRTTDIDPTADRQEPPPAPPQLPKYVHEPVAKQGVAELRVLAEWIEDLIEYRQRPLAIETEDNEELVEVGDNDAQGTQVIKKVPCGKECDGCPHGPYRYLVHRDGDSVVWEYKGPQGVIELFTRLRSRPKTGI